MAANAEKILKVTNKEKFHVGVGGQSFPGGVEGKIVRVRGSQAKQITACRYLKVEELDEAVGQVESTAGQRPFDDGEAPVQPTPDATGGQGAADGASNEVSPVKHVETREGEVQATEAAVKLASKLGIDLADVEASGARGQITRSDVEEFAENAE